ncbi:MAG: fasciclin domain-containing protein, partial [Candidatus Thermoplasmatota archaeon]|nr:fasciclin domain-containing protein [Candidatus Thermoplasmatota archaeon]
MKNVVDTAIEAGNFKTLVKAVQEAGLVDTLAGEGPFTIFAPTDEAFSKLPEGTIEELLKNKEKLTDILTYHVVADRVMADSVTNLSSASMVNGKDVSINT